MPVVPTGEILATAYRERYGVAAINIVNDLTLEAVLAAATELNAPLIVQTSVKTVRAVGYEVLYGMWTTMTADVPVPVALHLDHCPDREVISRCLATGWNSVLFDASRLPIEENQRQTVEVVAEAGRYGAQVEGEVESITGVEDGIGTDEVAARQDLDAVVRFVETTGVDVFAPAIGNAHGVYSSTPKLDAQRVTDIVDRVDIPMALHGGTGMSDDQFTDLIARGCAKINISTALKVTYMKANLAYLKDAERTNKWDPPSLFTAVSAAVREMAAEHIRRFGSAGRA
jgi:ketose-bisphosphate aldolase